MRGQALPRHTLRAATSAQPLRALPQAVSSTEPRAACGELCPNCLAAAITQASFLCDNQKVSLRITKLHAKAGCEIR